MVPFRRMAVAVGALALTLVSGASSAATTAPAEDGFRVETRSTYEFDPVAEVVHVAVDATLTNQRPNQVSGGYITEYYLPSYPVPMLSEAVGHRATAGGAALPVAIQGTESPRFEVAVIDLQPDLRYGATQSVHLTYDLPKVMPRSDGFTRFNKAYATFPVLALGDPGLSSVEIVLPDGWEVELVGDSMEESARDGQQVFTADRISDPQTWEVTVSARDDSKLIERTVELGDDTVDVLGWPDDPEWASFAEENVADGVPMLERLIGIDWPARNTIDVVETASPYLYGYAGWYRPLESVIEVGDELDQQVMLHELAHLWFNDDLFEGRWINEAFAEVVSAEAVGELGGDAPEPDPIDGDDPGRLKLNQWSTPDLQDGITEEQERYGYNASWAVMDAVADEIGLEELAEVIRAADAGHVAYRGPGLPEELARTFDWRELLDLLEEVGGSTEAAGLFERHVVAPTEVKLFDLRTTAREHYADLLDAGAGWAAPTSIRLAMSDWRFPTAEDLMEDAKAILEKKAELVEMTADLDVSEHLALQDTYEAGKDLRSVARTANDALRTAEVLGSAEDRVEQGAGPIGAVGLLFNGADDELDDAQRAFERGDYTAAQAAAHDAVDVVDAAVLMGILRLLALVASIAVALLLRAAWRQHRRLRAERKAAGEVEAAWGPEAPSEPDGAERVGGAVDGGGEGGV